MTARPAPETILELSSAHVAARALHVVAELGVADLLDGHPRTAGELAAGVAVDADALGRLLRVLETHGIFRTDAGGWAHTEASRWLRSDHPASLRAFARMLGMPFGWASFSALHDAVRSGRPAVRALDPDGPWAYLDRHPEEGAIFQEAMTAKAHDDVAAVLDAYDFSGHRRIADVAGGRGHLLAAILEAHPDATGVLFELPHVAAGVEPRARLEVVAGDLFADPLPACDAYLLMNIVHDWGDDESVAILRAVADAGRPAGATVLVIEAVLPEGPEPAWAKTLDLLMLALTGGRERTLGEYERLLGAAGMQLARVVRTATPFSILEARVG